MDIDKERDKEIKYYKKLFEFYKPKDWNIEDIIAHTNLRSEKNNEIVNYKEEPQSYREIFVEKVKLLIEYLGSFLF